MQKAQDVKEWLERAGLPDVVDLLRVVGQELEARDFTNHATMVLATADLIEWSYLGARRRAAS